MGNIITHKNINKKVFEYIIELDNVELSKFNNLEYCNKIIFLLKDILIDNVNEEELINIYENITNKNVKKYNDKIVLSISRFYIKIVHLYSCIISIIQPYSKTEYKDSTELDNMYYDIYNFKTKKYDDISIKSKLLKQKFIKLVSFDNFHYDFKDLNYVDICKKINNSSKYTTFQKFIIEYINFINDYKDFYIKILDDIINLQEKCISQFLTSNKLDNIIEKSRLKFINMKEKIGNKNDTFKELYNAFYSIQVEKTNELKKEYIQELIKSLDN